MHKLALTRLASPYFITRWWPAVSNRMLSISYVWWLSNIILWYISHPCCFSPVLLEPPAASALSITSLWLCFFSGAGSDLGTLRQTKQGTEQEIGGASFLRVGCGVICLPGDCLGTCSGLEKYDLCLKTFFLEIKKKLWKMWLGALIHSAEFLSEGNSLCSSFELTVQMWAVVQCNEKQRRICSVILLLHLVTSTLMEEHWRFQSMCFWRLQKKRNSICNFC